MLRVVAVCFLFVAQILAYPACQNWCYGQQRQLPAPPVGNNWGNICNAKPYTAPCGTRQLNGYPWGLPTGYPSYPTYPSGTYWPTGTIHGQQQPLWPWQVAPIQPPYPIDVVTQDPVTVVVQRPNYPPQKEWVCPTDPEPRARSIVGESQPELRECLYDENCPSAPIRQKCCYDSGIGDKVCKPAIPI